MSKNLRIAIMYGIVVVASLATAYLDRLSSTTVEPDPPAQQQQAAFEQVPLEPDMPRPFHGVVSIPVP